MRRLEPHERAAAVDTLALAFDADPMFRFLLPEDAGARRRWLDLIMAGQLALAAPDAHVFTVDGDTVAGVLVAFPPGTFPPPDRRTWRFLLSWRRPRLRWPGAHLRRHGRVVLDQMTRLHLRDPHYYIQCFGVHPAHQGQGVGRALLEPTVALADRDGVPTYLETTNEQNLGLYRRFGFEIVDEVRDLPGNIPPLWTMVRPC